jgi:hypothetical protein
VSDMSGQATFLPTHNSFILAGHAPLIMKYEGVDGR